MKVALLGPEGTYTHEAAKQYFGDGLETEFQPSITEVFKAGITGFVPVENSLGGGVRDTIDLFREHSREITGEHVLEIQHCLVSHEDSVEDVETVRSHPQALAQCSKYTESHGFETVEASSTAKAAKELQDGEAAIASRAAAEEYDLNILDEGIQDSASFTRFLVLEGEETEHEKTALIMNPSTDVPGLLHSMLGCFSGHGVNLTHIESRPDGELGNYFFYAEAEVDADSKTFERVRTCLETYTDVKVLGTYS